MHQSRQATAEGHDSRQLPVLVISIVLMVATSLGMSLRIYARLAALRKLFAEDVLMILGTVTSLALSASFIVGAYHGYGTHIFLLTAEDINTMRKIAFGIVFLYTVSSLLVKTSLLVLYLRLDQRLLMRVTVYILMFVVAAQKFSFLVVQAVVCIPLSSLAVGIEAGFSPKVTQHTYNVYGVLFAITDIAIYFVPLCMVHGMELPTKKKVAVGALFALGFLPMAAGCLRCLYTWNGIVSDDIFYDLVPGGILAQVELHLAILCGSASTFKILFKSLWPSCCLGNNTNASSFVDRHQQAVESPAHWPPYQHKITDMSLTPVSSIEGSWRSRMSPFPMIEEEANMELFPSAQRASRIMNLQQLQEAELAKLPADLQLRFPSVESRLGGRHAWMEDATGVKRVETKKWSLLYTLRT